jgi:hypothetical protein
VSLDDQTLQCTECGDSFVFSAGEQELLAVRGTSGTPSRCPRCRRPRSGLSRGEGGRGS